MQLVFLLLSIMLVVHVLVRRRGEEACRRVVLWRALGLWMLAVVSIDVPFGHSSHCGMAPSADLYMLGGVPWWPYAAYALVGATCLLRILGVSRWRIAAVFVLGLVSASLFSWRAMRAGSGECMEDWGSYMLVQGSLVLAVLWAHWRRGAAFPLVGIGLVSVMPWMPLSFWHVCGRICQGDSMDSVVHRLSGYYYVPNVENPGERIRVSDGNIAPLGSNSEVVFAATDGVHADICIIRFSGGLVARKEMLAD